MPTRRRRRLAVYARAAAAAAATIPATAGLAQGLPTGASSDCAVFTYSDHSLIVTQGVPNCVVNWDTFNIDAGNIVEFMQQGSWRLLNNVSASQFSTIAGTLRADGTIYIVNPAGIFFTGSAVVDVGGIYAAASAMDPADFMNGVDRFVSPSGQVVNQGSMTGHMVHLIGQRVANHGAIVSTGGVVTMVAGAQEVLLSDDGGRVNVRVDGVDLTTDLTVSPGGVVPTLTGTPGVENTGTIAAAGGQVVLGVGDVYALAIRNTGQIDARGGSVQLAATGGTVVHGGANASVAAGSLAMTGDAIYLDADVHVGAARFNDPVTIGSDLLIEGETPGDEADTIVFASDVDSEDGERNDLSVHAADTTLGGDVGARSRLGAIEISGAAAVDGNVFASEAITFGGAATLTGRSSQTLDAGAGTLTVGGTLAKANGNNLTLFAGTLIDLDGSVDVGAGNLVMTSTMIDTEGDLMSSGDVRITGTTDVTGSLSAGSDVVLNGNASIRGDVTATEDVNFFGAATVDGHVTAGEDVTFAGNASVTGDVVAALDVDFFGTSVVGGSVMAGDDATFFGAAHVVGDVSAAAGDVEFFGTAAVGGSVSAGDDAIFAALAQIGGDVEATDDVEFRGTADVGGSVFAGGDAEFFSTAVVDGSVHAIDDVEFFSTATVGGSVSAGDDADFHGAASIGGTLTAGDDVTFDQSASVGGDVIGGDDIDFFGDAVVNGSVSAFDDLTFFANAVIGASAAAGDDVVFAGTANVGGGVAAAGDVEFGSTATVGGPVTAGDDVLFAATANLGGDVIAGDRITFDAAVTLTGAGDQRLVANGVLRARDTIIKSTGGRLTLVGREQIVFNGPLVQALGDIELNPEGRVGVPTVATMNSSGNLSIRSIGGDVIMGQNEKLTALGDLRLTAAGRIVLGDLTSLGDMVVTAPSIFARARQPGFVFDDDGVFTRDAGIDFAAGGRFFFSTAPMLLGAGDVRFGSAVVDGDPLGTLGSFRLRVIDPLTRSLLRNQGFALDIRVDGPVISDLADALDDDLDDPDVTPPPPTPAMAPAAIAALERMGLRVRPATRAEVNESLAGRAVYSNLRSTGAPVAPENEIVIERLDPRAVNRAIEAHRALLATDARAALGAAWSDYKSTTDEPHGIGFRRYLETLPPPAPALLCLDGVRAVFGGLQLSGATSAEVRLSEARIIASVKPADMKRSVLKIAIDAAPVG